MPSFNADHTAKYQTTKDADIEETSFSAGDEVTLIQKWDNEFVLVKDDDGHFYNVPSSVVTE